MALRFSGLSQDYWQWPDGDGTPTWSGDTTGTLFPIFTGSSGVSAATNDNNAAEPKGDGIIAAASRSGAANDCGFRHSLNVGVNQGGGALNVDLTKYGAPWRELWMKWWQRYPVGLKPTSGWSSLASTIGNGAWTYNKDMALNNQGEANGRIEFGQKQGGVGIANHFDDWGACATSDGGNKSHANLSSNLATPSSLGFSFRAQMGGLSNGDGQWHSYQVHVVADSGSSRDGVFAAWFDDVKVSSHSTCRWSGGASSWTGWRSLRISNNQEAPGTDSTDLYQDYDDILISTSGFIADT